MLQDGGFSATIIPAFQKAEWKERQSRPHVLLYNSLKTTLHFYLYLVSQKLVTRPHAFILTEDVPG